MIDFNEISRKKVSISSSNIEITLCSAQDETNRLGHTLSFTFASKNPGTPATGITVVSYDDDIGDTLLEFASAFDEAYRSWKGSNG